jgi:hypothetical protein
MLCSPNCTNENFSKWLLQHAYIGPDRRHADNLEGSFFDLLKAKNCKKPILVIFDEIQAIYDVAYATSFWETIKRIQIEPSEWNIKVFKKTFLAKILMLIKRE